MYININNFFEFYDPEIADSNGEDLEVTVRNSQGIVSEPFRSRVLYGPRIDETRTSHNLYLDSPFTIYGKRFGSEPGEIVLRRRDTRWTLYNCSQFASCVWTNNSITLQDRNLLANIDFLYLSIGTGTSRRTFDFSINVLTGTPSPSPSPTSAVTTPAYQTGDFDHNGVIDQADVDVLNPCYNPFRAVSEACRRTDLNNDGRVNALDYSILLTQAGR